MSLFSHQLSTVYLFGITSLRLTREQIKNCLYHFFCSFSDVFCWFQPWNHRKRLKMNKKDWKWLKKAVQYTTCEWIDLRSKWNICPINSPVSVWVINDQKSEALGLVDPSRDVDIASHIFGMFHLLGHNSWKVGNL